MAKYSEITDQQIQSKLTNHYQREITALEKVGFHHLAYCMEDHGDLSAITQLRVIPLARANGEIIFIKWPFRIISANILMSIEDPPSIALCMGLGIKIYTMFYDGKITISSTFESRAMPSLTSTITRLPPQPSLAETWSHHKAEVLKKSAEIDFISEKITFGDYVLMSAFEEDPSQYVHV